MRWNKDLASHGNAIQILALATCVMSLGLSSSEIMAQSQLSTQAHSTTASSKKQSSTTRKVHRLGTAIPPSNTDRSINISSTDAGPILPYHSYSGCINCGVVEHMPHFNYGHNMHAITSGIIGGTIANKIHRRSVPTGQLGASKQLHPDASNTFNMQQPIIMKKQFLPLP